MKNLERLARLGGPPLSKTVGSVELLRAVDPLGQELLELLSIKNGFYAFESALHVLPIGTSTGGSTLEEWNRPELWRDSYGDLIEGSPLFFAEDIFGGQFCVKPDGVYSFDPETGAADRLGSTLEEWAALMLDDAEVVTGFPLAYEWQVQNGALVPGKRLAPVTPFVTSGEFSVANLRAIDAVEAMRVRAHLARTIRDLPDGASITIKVTE